MIRVTARAIAATRRPWSRFLSREDIGSTSVRLPILTVLWNRQSKSENDVRASWASRPSSSPQCWTPAIRTPHRFSGTRSRSPSKGRDLIGLAQTGTGKTAAFTLPILQRLIGGPRRTRVLVLTPTRELAAQVEESFLKYGQAHPISSHGRLRRRANRSAGARPAARRRCGRGDAGPTARSSRASERRLRRSRSPGARRGRPDARHGVRAPDQSDRRADASLSADAAVQRDDAGGGRSAGAEVSAQADRGAGRAPLRSREHRDARGLSRAPRAQERAARSSCCAATEWTRS